MAKAKIIGIAQLKGGSGKTTVATSLSAALGASGGETLLIDCDPPQFSADSWFAMRKEAGREDWTDHTSITSSSEEELASLIDQHSSKFKYIVLDAPPRGEITTKLIMKMSNLIIIPVNASMVDLWATYDTEELVKGLKANKRARLLLNRYRPFTNSSREVKKALKKEIGIDQLRTTLGFRTAYMDALGTGLGVQESGMFDRKARKEMESLTREVLRILK